MAGGWLALQLTMWGRGMGLAAQLHGIQSPTAQDSSPSLFVVPTELQEGPGALGEGFPDIPALHGLSLAWEPKIPVAN